MIFIGYAKNHAGDCYCMYNPATGYMTETRDITWLNHMYCGQPETSNEVVVYPQVACPLKLEEVEAREGGMLNASEPKIKFKDEENKWNVGCMRCGRVVNPHY